MQRVLVHRYDNEPDILAVEERGYSDVYSRAASNDFQLVAVVPTLGARTDIAVVAEAASEQYVPFEGAPWPGRPDRYPVRVDVRNVQYTTIHHVRNAFAAAGVRWAAAWTVRLVTLDERLLFDAGAGAPLLRRERTGEGPSLPGELVDRDLVAEGAVRRVLVNGYERSPRARRRCIRHYGTACSVCGFDFGAVYGEGAAGFIEVHHLRPLAEAGGVHLLDPIRDLRPVCSNCHSVIHLRTPAYTIEEVRALLRRPDDAPARHRRR